MLRGVTLLAAGLAAALLYLFGLKRPRPDRDWDTGFERLPRFQFGDGAITIADLRDDRYSGDGVVARQYVTRVARLDQLTRVWFVVEPFELKPIPLPGVAHTYFVFDFAAAPPIAVSVEARRAKGQVFNALFGVFNQYELMYSWSTELDGTGRRVLVEHNQLAMYPVLISVEAARALFVQLAQASHELEHRPRFYNTLTDNCTSELARGANRLQPHVIPFNRALIFPRYAVPELARLGFLPTDVPAAALPARYAISDLVAEYAVSPDFSEQLRRHLPRPVA